MYISKLRKYLNYIINHVFLPLKLPQKDDDDVAKGAALVKEILTTLQLLQAHISLMRKADQLDESERVIASHLKESEASTSSTADLMSQSSQRP